MKKSLLGYYRRTLVGLVSDLHALRKDPTDLKRLREIQERLLASVKRVEGRVRKFKKERSEMRRALRTPEAREYSTERRREYKRRLFRAEGKVPFYQWLLTVLKSIGDGVALLYLDRWDIKPVAFRQDAGFILGSKGARLEREFMVDTIESDRPAILNDLTNNLRVGDVTVIEPDGFVIVEVKSGNPSGARVSRQQATGESITSYLSTDTATDLYGLEGKFRRHEVHASVEDHVNKLNEAISSAEVNSSVNPEPGLTYLVLRDFDEVWLSDVIDSMEKPVIADIPPVPEQYPAYVPLCLLIREPEEWFNYLKGELVLSVALDISVLESRFAQRGIKSEFDLDESSAHPLQVSDSPRRDPEWKIRIGRHFFSRVFYEFLALDWFVAEIDHILEETRGQVLGDQFPAPPD